jgi:hypothetical protein
MSLAPSEPPQYHQNSLRYAALNFVDFSENPIFVHFLLFFSNCRVAGIIARTFNGNWSIF